MGTFSWTSWGSLLFATGIVFVAGLYFLHGLWKPLVTAGFTSILFYMSLTDLRDNVVPNVVVLPAFIPSIVLYPIGPLGIESGILINLGMSVVGGVVAVCIASIIYVVSQNRFGAGDVKLIGLIGTMVGLQYLPWVLIFGTLAIGITAIGLLAIKQASLRDTMPMAPFLGLATVAVLLFARHIPPFHDAMLRLNS